MSPAAARLMSPVPVRTTAGPVPSVAPSLGVGEGSNVRLAVEPRKVASGFALLTSAPATRLKEADGLLLSAGRLVSPLGSGMRPAEIVPLTATAPAARTPTLMT